MPMLSQVDQIVQDLLPYGPEKIIRFEVTDTLLESWFLVCCLLHGRANSTYGTQGVPVRKWATHILLHSIQELASEYREVDAAFAEVIEWGKILDRYYIPTRYPDALALPAVPFRSFTQDDARHKHTSTHRV